MVLLADGEQVSAVIRSLGEAALMVLRADGERASTVLRAKGAAEARQSLAQAELQRLSDLRTSVAPFGVRGVDYYLSRLEYLGHVCRWRRQGRARAVSISGHEESATHSRSPSLRHSCTVSPLLLPHMMDLPGGHGRGPVASRS